MTVSVASNGRSIQAELNLVPFIDFLSVLISFLLVSAVWTQLSQINIGHHPDASSAEPIVAPPTKPPEIVIKRDGFLLRDGITVTAELSKDGGLPQQLQALKSANPEQQQIKVIAESGVSYEKVIAVVDLCLKSGFADVNLGANQN